MVAAIKNPEMTSIEKLVMTPEYAQVLLSRNDSNRPVREHYVKHLSRQMEQGLWRLNGETIKIGLDGTLLDGQHRLLACVTSGVSFETYIVRGLAQVFDTIDIGSRRTAADALALNGEVNTNVLAGALHLLWRHENGLLHRGGQPNPSPQEIEMELEKHPDIRRSLTAAYPAKQILSQTMGAALHCLFAERDADLADLFFESLATGTNLRENDPVRLLRERLIRDRMSKSRLVRNEVLALVIKAWNHLRQGRKIGTLKWTTGEAFPVIL